MSEKRARTPGVLSAAIEDQFDRVLTSRTHGRKDINKVLNEELTHTSIMASLEHVVGEYNTEVQKANRTAQFKNKRLARQLRRGEITASEAAACMVPLKRHANKVTKMVAHRFGKRYGWGKRKCGMPGNFLDYNNPKMQAVRDAVHNRVANSHVHPRLVLNFDQVWRLKYRPARKVLFKPSANAGNLCDSLKGHGKLMKVRAQITKAMLANLPPTKKPSVVQVVDGEEEAPRVSPVSGGRLPRTVTTTTWMDGCKGPLFVVLREGDVKDELLDSLNAKHAGRAFFVTSGRKDTHMFDGALTIRFYEECLTKAMRAKRKDPRAYAMYARASHGCVRVVSYAHVHVRTYVCTYVRVCVSQEVAKQEGIAPSATAL